jgi:hypothetical protein
MSKLKLSRKTRILDVDHVFEEMRHALNGCINQHPGSLEILREKFADVLWRAEDLMKNK